MYVESKKREKREVRFVPRGGKVRRNWVKVVKRYTLLINKYWGCKLQHDVGYICCRIYLRVLKRVNP